MLCKKVCLLVVAMGLMVASQASAAATAIQFDIATDAVYDNATASPGHATGDIPLAQNRWNAVSGDVSSGLIYADGTAAPGVQIDIGRSSGALGATMNWASTPSYAVNGAAPNDYWNTNLMTDEAYYNGRSIGVRVSGLAPGTYRVYGLIRDAWANPDRNANVSIGVNLNIDLASPVAIIANNALQTWVSGVNYAAVDVTTSSTSDWITIISTGTTDVGGGNIYSMINGLQIVGVQPVPEPSTLALLAAGLVSLLAYAWRKRK